MPKKKNEDQEMAEGQEALQQIIMQAQASQGNGDREFRVAVLSMAKEILERNAALQWEQDKTKGLTVTADEIIEEAQKLLAFTDAGA